MRQGLGLICLCLVALLGHGAPDPMTAGRDWLLTQVRDDGAYHNLQTTATATQATAEVLALAGMASDAARGVLQQDPFQGTEYLARRLLAGTGDSRESLQSLWERQNADGGFGDLPGYQSTVFDTAHALKALAALGETAPDGVAYLLDRQLSDGAWTLTPNSASVYLTALAMEALHGFRDSARVASALAQGVAYLETSLETPLEIPVQALALRALLPLSGGAGLDASVVALSDRQGADGSWDGDVHTTALVLQVLELAGQLIPNPDLGVVRGRLVEAATGWEVSAAALSLSGPVTRAESSDADGGFQMVSLAPGSYVLRVEHPGYQALDLAFGVSAGEVLDLGSLRLLGDPAQTAVTLSGTVRDQQGNPLSGAQLQIGDRQILSDADGRYRFHDLDAGFSEITVELPGYRPASTNMNLTPGSHVLFSPLLVADTAPPPAGLARLTGLVVDAGSDGPLSGVRITLAGVPEILSGADGGFELDLPEAIAAGDGVVMSLDLEGYRTRQLTVVAQAGQTVDLGEVRLAPEIPLLADLQLRAMDTSEVFSDAMDFSLGGSLALVFENRGPVAAGAFRVAVYPDADGDGLRDADEAWVGKAVVNGLAGGEQASLAVDLQGIAAYRDSPLVAVVDQDGRVPELNEGNNQLSSLSQCTAQGDPVSELAVVEKWRWGDFRDGTVVTSTTLVAPLMDSDGDGTVSGADRPAVLAISTDGFPDGKPGVVWALDGETGAPLWSYDGIPAHGPSQPAVGDLDGDGFPEVVVHRHGGGSLAISGDGQLLWVSDFPDSLVVGGYGGPSLADLDGDGLGEILFGSLALNHDGSLRWQGEGSHRGHGLSVVADLDGDGSPEVVVGPSVYAADGTLRWELLGLPDGKVAVAQLDEDPQLEIVLAGRIPNQPGGVYLLDHDGEVLWGPVAVSTTAVGAPTVADVDGDGQAEIGVVGTQYYSLLEADGSVRWQHAVWESSAQTAGTFFDLDGDGSLELIYGDQTTLWFLDGVSGAVRYQHPRSSYTGFELPVVADVDLDGHAEIVVGSKTRYANLVVLENALDDWPATRSIFNQHAYHPGMVHDGASLPRQPGAAWAAHNSFRVNPPLATGALADPSVGGLRFLEQAGALPGLQARVANGGAVAQDGVAVVFEQMLGGAPRQLGSLSVDLGATAYQDVILPAVTLRGEGAITARLQVAEELDCRTSNNQVSANLHGEAVGQLSLDASTALDVDEPLVVNLRVDNPGTMDRQYALLWWVEDSQGNHLSELPSPTIGILQGGAYREIQYAWHPGSVLAGAYRLVGSLLDSGGRELDRQWLDFEILGDGEEPRLTLLMDRGDYQPGESLTAQVMIHNPSANQVLEAGDLRLIVRDPQGQVIVTTDRSISALAPGQYHRMDIGVTLDPTASPGSYGVLVALLGAGPTSSATATFEVRQAAAPEPVVSVSVGSSGLYVGDQQVCCFQVSFSGQPTPALRSGLLALATGDQAGVELFQEVPDDGGNIDWHRVFGTDGLAEGEWACVLEVADGGEWRVLGYGVFGLSAAPVEQPPVEEPPVEEPPVEEPPVEEPPVEEPPVEEPPVEEPPVEEPPVEEPPVEEPPVEEPPVEEPPVEQPPAEEPPVEEFPVEEPPVEEPPVEEPPMEEPPVEVPPEDEFPAEQPLDDDLPDAGMAPVAVPTMGMGTLLSLMALMILVAVGARLQVPRRGTTHRR